MKAIACIIQSFLQDCQLQKKKNSFRWRKFNVTRCCWYCAGVPKLLSRWGPHHSNIYTITNTELNIKIKIAYTYLINVTLGHIGDSWTELRFLLFHTVKSLLTCTCATQCTCRAYLLTELREQRYG